MIGSAQLLDGLSWHGLGEAQTAPGVGGSPYLGHHWLLQHRCVCVCARAIQRKLTYTAFVCLTFKLVTLDPQTLWQPWPFIYVAARLYFGLNYGLTLGATNDSVWSDPYLWLPTVFSVRSRMPEKVSKFVVSLFK